MKSWLASIPVTNLVLFFLALAISLFLLAYLSYLVRRFWRGLDSLELKDRFAIKNDFIRTVGQILGGALFLVGLYLNWLNIMVTLEKEFNRNRDQAIEQLGSEKLELRLGSISALERIAGDSEKNHGPIMEVLTAYVRKHAPAPKPLAAPAAPKKPEEGQKAQAAPPLEIKPTSDVQAVLTVIGRRARTFGKGEHQRLDLRATDLRGADLWNAHLEKAYLREAHLEGADLRGAHLEGGYLRDAEGLAQEQLGLAITDKETVLPDYLKQPQPEKPKSK